MTPETIEAARVDYFSKREAYHAAPARELERAMLQAFYLWQLRMRGEPEE